MYPHFDIHDSPLQGFCGFISSNIEEVSDEVDLTCEVFTIAISDTVDSEGEDIIHGCEFNFALPEVNDCCLHVGEEVDDSV